MRLLPESIENPGLLPLLLLAFLPLLLHILDRRRARTVAWPAMRFLAPKGLARVRRLRRREALLILLRSVLVLLIAYSLLRPICTEERSAALKARDSRGVVLVIDTSFSMAYREPEESRSAIDKAREAALQLLDDLLPGDKVALLPRAGDTQGRKKTDAGEAALDPDAARRAVRDLRPGGAGFHLLAALDRAADLLVKLPAASREVYVFTDLQAGILTERDPGRFRFIAERLRAGGSVSAPLPAPVLRLIDCGALHPSNRFVSSIAPPPLAAGTDEPTELRATVEASGEPRPEDAAPVPVRLLVDGAEVESTSVILPSGGAGGKVPVKFTYRFPAAGAARVSVELPPDGLAEDDSRHAVLEVLDRIGVLILGTTVDGPGPGTARYAELALAPRAEELLAPPVIFRSTFASKLDPELIGENRVVIITGMPRMDADAASHLERFVRGGGGLLIFAGEETEPVSLTENLHRGGRGILPGRLLPRETSPVEGGEKKPLDLATGHPALSIFKDPEEGDFSRIAVRRWTRVADLAPDSSVLARLDPESPWIVERPAGSGKVILVATSAAPDDSDLPRTPLFLPLLHRLVRYLAARDGAERTVTAGEPISVPLPPGGASANVPPEESRLERLGDDALQDLRSALGIEVTRDLRDAANIVATTRVKREQWPAFLALAAFVLLAEQLLARSFARGRAPWRGG